MDFNLDQMRELIQLFENSDLTEISIESEGYQVTLKKNSGTGAKPTDAGTVSGKISKLDNEQKQDWESQEAQESKEKQASESEAGTRYITSPIVGTFYRSPSPEDPPYAKVGDVVEEGETVCVVEAMKVMNEVKADIEGKIGEICVEDGDPVEYGQKLFRLVPRDRGN